MNQTSSTLLAIAMTVAGYLSALCATPPNPPPIQKDRHGTDRIKLIVGSFATIVRRTLVTAVMYHALVAVSPFYAPARLPQVCPLSRNTNSDLFAWNAITVSTLGLIYIGAYIRLSAYGGLGKSFTFQLAAPADLVTTGVYGWIQHPSYTGFAMIAIGCVSLFLRWDATPACWIPTSALSPWHGWGITVIAGLAALGFWVLIIRVRDEEEMLRQKFGKKWEEWHHSTKRFIPGLV
ncbi:Phospholipid methyltransferase [Penicillium antarcticum]|uniref:Phospholipid methyltransferase n=1 Tax=Penicillium antarcticum TaxID=416450 RepID=UPI00238ED711|nr:Phospholipid methyltransferase [Penicillium antarcticum]KAJ5302386.1 Phospholipid methyltransferase [Penicillium antarcticum]